MRAPTGHGLVCPGTTHRDRQTLLVSGPAQWPADGAPVRTPRRMAF